MLRRLGPVLSVVVGLSFLASREPAAALTFLCVVPTMLAMELPSKVAARKAKVKAELQSMLGQGYAAAEAQRAELGREEAAYKPAYIY